MKNPLRPMLAAGRNRISLGRTAEVIELIAQNPALFRHLMELLWEEDEGIAGRAAHVLAELTPQFRNEVAKRSDELIGLFAESTGKKARWQLAIVLGQLPFSRLQAERLAAEFALVLDPMRPESSSVLKTWALDGLYKLGRQEPTIAEEARLQLELCQHTGTPAMRARSRNLLKLIEKEDRQRKLRRRSID